jgi:hypothetical protein
MNKFKFITLRASGSRRRTYLGIDSVVFPQRYICKHSASKKTKIENNRTRASPMRGCGGGVGGSGCEGGLGHGVGGTGGGPVAVLFLVAAQIKK